MTEPSQYFKGRTVQEQMNEVIGYVDARAEEVAAAKADDVLEPAEQAKDAAQAAQAAAEDAQDAAEAARDTTLAALPQIQQDITDLKAEDVTLDGRLDNVELRITTAEGNIVTIQGRVTAVETKNSQQDSAIAALQTADAQNVKINNINQYAVGLTGNQPNIGGIKGFLQEPKMMRGIAINTAYDVTVPGSTVTHSFPIAWFDANNVRVAYIEPILGTDGKISLFASVRNTDGTERGVVLVVSSI